jgi:DNA-binding CsgD family transcriptional regulator
MRGRGRPKHPDILTPREWEVLALLREGGSNEEIAQALGVTLATARFHVSEIIGKLGVANRHEAAAWQPEPTSSRPAWTRALVPFAAVSQIKWSSLGAVLSVVVVAGVITVVALLVWGIAQTSTLPSSSSSISGFCTPGPTNTPPTPAKLISTPDLRPDSVRMTEIAVGQQRNRDWSKRFIAAGCDPHTLSDSTFEVFNPGPTYNSLDQAIAGADVIVRAHVDNTKFSLSGNIDLPNGDVSVNDLPNADVSLTVLESLKGDAPQTLVLAQGGGPVPQAYWGALEHPEGFPILLTGDDVILLAQRRPPNAGYPGGYVLLAYRGVYYVREGKVFATKDNPCASAIDGTPLTQEVDLIRASLARSAGGHVSSSPGC